ncbi:MAG: tRNA (guanosine(18)-2'-O)-methyltransferase [Ignavibacteria bacterium]|nr:tRNA (guanosine(18)-2'-O)-methyltransferase [Ignavibacteria bacterium]
MTPKRFSRLKEVTQRRQKYLTVVLENIHDPHNVSAILRTADAVGIDKVYLIYNSSKFPKIGKTSSASAKKWIELKKYSVVEECFLDLRKEKFKIYSTSFSSKSKSYSLYDLNFTGKTAFVFGNEHSGVSEEVSMLADKNFIIPMYGMVQSLNVSVAAAICFYEALRQREIRGMYGKSNYSKKELTEKLNSYLNR